MLRRVECKKFERERPHLDRTDSARVRLREVPPVPREHPRRLYRRLGFTVKLGKDVPQKKEGHDVSSSSTCAHCKNFQVVGTKWVCYSEKDSHNRAHAVEKRTKL